jgi:ferric-dicitrate binding protein FerR (iron transport regulator)
MDKNYLIEKWLKNELTEAEKQSFSKLDDAEFNQNIIDNAIHFKASHHAKINDFNTFKTHYDSQNTPIKKLNWWSPLIKIASVLVITLGVYFAFFNNPETLYKTIASEKISVELPDESKVELNAQSSIAFNSKNWKNNRAVKLQGEAYFKVAKGNVFDVITTQGKVTVVGTQFNVKQRENYFEVKCFEGIVKVIANDMTKQLVAGETFQLLNGRLSEGKTNASGPKWMDNMSEFEAIPFKQVLAELERQYNIQITIESVDIDRLFTGGFMHTNLENALKAVTQPMNVTFELNTSNMVIIHGTNN